VLTSGDRGIRIAVFVAVDVNFIGKHVPPKLLLPRAHLKKYMLTDAFTAGIGAVH
jgi:hypothetical protein